MGQTPYLSTDPNAGEYLSTDPNAGNAGSRETPRIGGGVTIGGQTYPSSYFDTPDPSGTSLGALFNDPRGTMQRIGASVKTDLQDPKLWLAAAMSYLGPKAVSAMPTIARTMKGVATPQMAKDLAQVALGEGRVTAGARIAERVSGAMKARGEAAPSAPPEATSPLRRNDVRSDLLKQADKAMTEADVAQRERYGYNVLREMGKEPVSAAAASPAAEPAAAPRPRVSGKPSPKSKAEASPLPADLKTKLSSAEFREAQRMVQRGMDPEAALRSVLGQRAFAKRFGLPDAEKVRVSVSDRNATGRWPEE
jgi:hypothetical protein